MIYQIKTKVLTMLIAIALLTCLLSACDSANELQSSTEIESQPEPIYSSSEAPASSTADLEASSSAPPEVKNPTLEVSQSVPPPKPTEEDWQTLFDRATAMEKYLRGALTSQDIGGMYVFTGTAGDTLGETAKDTAAGKPRLCIWVSKKDVVNTAIQSYPSKKADVVLQNARWSLNDMESFADELKGISLNAGETILVHTSEESNQVIANISKSGADRLTAEINSLIQLHSVPKDCVLIWTMDTGKNPVA